MSLETWQEHIFLPPLQDVVGNTTQWESCPIGFSYLPVFVQFDVSMGCAPISCDPLDY